MRAEPRQKYITIVLDFIPNMLYSYPQASTRLSFSFFLLSKVIIHDIMKLHKEIERRENMSNENSKPNADNDFDFVEQPW